MAAKTKRGKTMKTLNKKNVLKVLTEIQDRGNSVANVIATTAIKEFGLKDKRHSVKTKT